MSSSSRYPYNEDDNKTMFFPSGGSSGTTIMASKPARNVGVQALPEKYSTSNPSAIRKLKNSGTLSKTNWRGDKVIAYPPTGALSPPKPSEMSNDPHFYDPLPAGSTSVPRNGGRRIVGTDTTGFQLPFPGQSLKDYFLNYRTSDGRGFPTPNIDRWGRVISPYLDDPRCLAANTVEEYFRTALGADGKKLYPLPAGYTKYPVSETLYDYGINKSTQTPYFDGMRPRIDIGEDTRYVLQYERTEQTFQGLNDVFPYYIRRNIAKARLADQDPRTPQYPLDVVMNYGEAPKWNPTETLREYYFNSTDVDGTPFFFIPLRADGKDYVSVEDSNENLDAAMLRWNDFPAPPGFSKKDLTLKDFTQARTPRTMIGESSSSATPRTMIGSSPSASRTTIVSTPASPPRTVIGSSPSASRTTIMPASRTTITPASPPRTVIMPAPTPASPPRAVVASPPRAVVASPPRAVVASPPRTVITPAPVASKSGFIPNIIMHPDTRTRYGADAYGPMVYYPTPVGPAYYDDALPDELDSYSLDRGRRLIGTDTTGFEGPLPGQSLRDYFLKYRTPDGRGFPTPHIDRWGRVTTPFAYLGGWHNCSWFAANTVEEYFRTGIGADGKKLYPLPAGYTEYPVSERMDIANDPRYTAATAETTRTYEGVKDKYVCYYRNDVKPFGKLPEWDPYTTTLREYYFNALDIDGTPYFRLPIYIDSKPIDNVHYLKHDVERGKRIDQMILGWSDFVAPPGFTKRDLTLNDFVVPRNLAEAEAKARAKAEAEARAKAEAEAKLQAQARINAERAAARELEARIYEERIRAEAEAKRAAEIAKAEALKVAKAEANRIAELSVEEDREKMKLLDSIVEKDQTIWYDDDQKEIKEGFDAKDRQARRNMGMINTSLEKSGSVPMSHQNIYGQVLSIFGEEHPDKIAANSVGEFVRAAVNSNGEVYGGRRIRDITREGILYWTLRKLIRYDSRYVFHSEVTNEGEKIFYYTRKMAPPATIEHLRAGQTVLEHYFNTWSYDGLPIYAIPFKFEGKVYTKVSDVGDDERVIDFLQNVRDENGDLIYPLPKPALQPDDEGYIATPAPEPLKKWWKYVTVAWTYWDASPGRDGTIISHPRLLRSRVFKERNGKPLIEFWDALKKVDAEVTSYGQVVKRYRKYLIANTLEDLYRNYRDDNGELLFQKEEYEQYPTSELYPNRPDISKDPRFAPSFDYGGVFMRRQCMSVSYVRRMLAPFEALPPLKEGQSLIDYYVNTMSSDGLPLFCTGLTAYDLRPEVFAATEKKFLEETINKVGEDGRPLFPDPRPRLASPVASPFLPPSFDASPPVSPLAPFMTPDLFEQYQSSNVRFSNNYSFGTRYDSPITHRLDIGENYLRTYMQRQFAMTIDENDQSAYQLSLPQQETFEGFAHAYNDISSQMSKIRRYNHQLDNCLKQLAAYCFNCCRRFVGNINYTTLEGVSGVASYDDGLLIKLSNDKFTIVSRFRDFMETSYANHIYSSQRFIVRGIFDEGLLISPLSFMFADNPTFPSEIADDRYTLSSNDFVLDHTGKHIIDAKGVKLGLAGSTVTFVHESQLQNY